MARVGASECLRADLVCAFIDEHYQKRAHNTQGKDTPFVNYRPLSKQASIQLHRWKREELRTNIWALDEFLTKADLHLSDFFNWCEKVKTCNRCGRLWSLAGCCGDPVVGASPWLLGCPPAWHEESWDYEDAHWRDPLATIELATVA